MLRRILPAFYFLLTSSAAYAQAPGDALRGFTFEGRAQSSVSDMGAVLRLDPMLGYRINSSWSVFVGAPFYFYGPSATVREATGLNNVRGLGNAYGELRLALPNPFVVYSSTLRVGFPTGDSDKGLSPDHTTVEWSNYFERSLGRLTPFAEVGLANSVSDTEFFVRPYTTSGFLTQLQGGARFRPNRWLLAGAAGYALEPTGQQTVISRVVPASQNIVPPAGRAALRAIGLSRAPFAERQVTTGPAQIALDRGFSTWLVLRPTRSADCYGGYTRSTHYGFGVLFFGVGVRLWKPFGF